MGQENLLRLGQKQENHNQFCILQKLPRLEDGLLQRLWVWNWVFYLLFIFDSGEFMLNPTQKDIQELQKEFEDDARERAKEIALSEKLDNELLKKREAGEIGVSHGTDNYVSFLMIGLALFVSLILLLTTFGTPHIWF